MQTLEVNALNGCSGSPNLSSDSGCVWISTFAVGCSGEERVKPPSWLGAIVSGPERNRAYSSPIAALPNRLCTRWFNVTTFFTLNAIRSCR